MNYSTLAKELRKRQLERGFVKKELINNISDEKIIDCYITCSCCGLKAVQSKAELNKIILESKNVEDFLDKTQIH